MRLLVTVCNIERTGFTQGQSWYGDTEAHSQRSPLALSGPKMSDTDLCLLLVVMKMALSFLLLSFDDGKCTLFALWEIG